MMTSQLLARPAFAGAALRSAKAGRVQARMAVRVAAEFQSWMPGNPPMEHLSDYKIGNHGFDPLYLSSDPELRPWLQHSEIFHGRVAMTGAAGILFTSILHSSGADVPEWYEAGKVNLEQSNIPLPALIWAMVLMSQWVELKRWQDLKNPGSQGDGSFLGITDDFKGMGNAYPGGRFFDPFGLSRGDAAKLEEYKLKELKNGRLAMVGVLGFFAQYFATGKGPVDNLIDHLNAPFQTTFATNGVSLPFLQ